MTNFYSINDNLKNIKVANFLSFFPIFYKFCLIKFLKLLAIIQLSCQIGNLFKKVSNILFIKDRMDFIIDKQFFFLS